VVGTTSDFFPKYKVRSGESVRFSSGESFDAPDEVVLGSEVVASGRLKLGDLIVLSHGHSEHGDGFERHEDHPFKVVGIIGFTGTPIDRSVYVSLEGMGAIHQEPVAPDSSPTKTHKHEASDDHDHDHDHDHGHDHDHEAHSSFVSKDGKILVTQVSGFFVGAKNRMASLELQRQLNTWTGEALSAILPGVAMSELWKNLAIFESAMAIISGCVVFTGVIGLFVSLLILSGQRRREMVVLRAVGAGPKTIFTLLAGEAVFIVLFAIVLGMGFMHLGLFMLSPWIEKKFAIHLELSTINVYDLIFAGILLLVGAIVGILASVKAYRSAMHDGLATKF
jgi:putative ABC transport system permease protein